MKTEISNKSVAIVAGVVAFISGGVTFFAGISYRQGFPVDLFGRYTNRLLDDWLWIPVAVFLFGLFYIYFGLQKKTVNSFKGSMSLISFLVIYWIMILGQDIITGDSTGFLPVFLILCLLFLCAGLSLVSTILIFLQILER